MTPASEAFSPCFPKRRWCCQTWLPKALDVGVSLIPVKFRKKLSHELRSVLQHPSKYGHGLWCVQGPSAKFLNPIDLFPP